MKFGGSSVGNAQRIRNVTAIIKTHLDRRPVVVVSALGGITDSLLDIATAAGTGNDTMPMLEKVISVHYDTIGELSLDASIISEEVTKLRRLVRSLSPLEQITPVTLDKLVSFGERMSARIVAGSLSKSGVEAHAFDAYDLGMITDSNFGNADVLPESYQKLHDAILQKSGTLVITGFLGKSKEGRITTLGRGGSDYTASIVGAAIVAEEIQIWTDVNGIMTADPRIVKAAKSIDLVSYNEASELAALGAKVLHPKTILPAIEKNIPVRILNTFNPTHKGTLVQNKIDTGSRVASITYKKQILLMNISTRSMFKTPDFSNRVFEIFETHKIPVDLVFASEVNVSVAIDSTYNNDALIADLTKIANVQIKTNRAKVSVVGNDMMRMNGVLGKMLSALKSFNIHKVSSNSSSINQSFVVEEENTAEVVQTLHTKFFKR
ncbi:MAG: aspartate kinase [Candidatus Micrarchaeota archaeon]|nr:aspartate kinase [Candidatus Micrarchaeota archaeon]